MDEKTLKKLADAYKQGNPEAKKAIDNLKKLALGQGEEAEKAKSILTAIQGYIKKAAKGAKLDYIKSLKHQCAEDEELYYYKKGGSVGCGCKKKEDGGEVKKDCGSSSIVSKFKKMRAGGQLPEILSEKKATAKPKYKTTSPDKNGEYTDNRGNIIITKKGMEEREKTLNANKNEEGKADPNRKQKLSKSNKTPIKACGSKIKKHQEGSVIVKFKALRKGGSLNGIPFYQGGTPKGGINGRGINGEYYYNPVPYNAGEVVGTFPLIDVYNAIEERSKTTRNPFVETGIVNTPGGPGGAAKKLISLGKPFKTINGVNYYKNAAGELKTALEMAKELTAVKNARPKSWFPRKHHTDHYVPKNATGIYNELEKAAYEGEQMMKNPFADWRDFDEMNSVNYWKRGGFIKK